MDVDAEPSSTGVTRLAPSPTGALHLGNARTFLINYAMARRAGWRIVLRLEDLDGPRIKPGAAEEALDLFRWLGITWDEGPYTQLKERAPYMDALHRLLAMGVAYPCGLSRREIEEAASAPAGDDHELHYAGLSRHRIGQMPGEGDGVRLVVESGETVFEDRFCGRQAIDVAASVGDFPIATRNGLPSYQLAVVVDDAGQGVTEVVRADDLLSSAARQLRLYRLLGLQPEPRYTHVPLVIGPDGHKLAKRHGDTRVLSYRDRGVPAARVIGLLGYWCGLSAEREPMSTEVFVSGFDLAKLPREAVTFSVEDERWLCQA